MVAEGVVLFCWLIFLIYWAISWRSVKPTKEIKVNFNGRWRLIVLGVVVLYLLLRHFGLALPGCQPDWSGCHIRLINSTNPQSVLWQTIASLLAVFGLIVAIIARKTLGDNWSSNIDIKRDHQLMTSGIYGYVRHPIYSGVMLMLLANVIIANSLSVILVNIAAFCFFIFKLKQEEVFLIEHFPKEYPEYKRRVKALIPFVI